MIEPKTLKGFRDYPPELAIPREGLIETAKRVFRSYGYPPIDTPALEYAEVLLGKMDAESEIQRQLYRFKDQGDRDVVLRFDLTVPFARFAAQNVGKLGTPFKRYHIGPVWRGENIQAGRYREFMQCDFDIIGTTSNAADVETALVIHDLMVALGFERFVVRINSRLILNGLLEPFAAAGIAAAAVLRALDKLGKVGHEAVAKEMVDVAKATPALAEQILGLAATHGTPVELLDRLSAYAATSEAVRRGVDHLRELLEVAKTVGIPEDRFQIDLAICRGLDYYTGTIYETYLTDLPKIGSVCSGGRYDDLAGLYTKQKLPGVGASLGLDRLLAAMETLNLLPKTGTPASVLIVQFATEGLGEYHKIARTLRASGIGVEVFPEAKKLGAQLQYAEAKGFRLALIAGPDELAKGVVKVKALATRSEQVFDVADVVTKVQELL